MKYTQEQIKEQYDLLPQELKNAVSSVDTTNLVVDIAQKNNLHIDQITELVDETGLVLLGLTHPNEFVNNVQNRLNVSKNLAETIVTDINERVLLKIREALKRFHTIQTKETDEIEKRENILKEIENPIETRLALEKKPIGILKNTDIIERKLMGVVKTPVKEKKLDEKTKYKIDPYRETID